MIITSAGSYQTEVAGQDLEPSPFGMIVIWMAHLDPGQAMGGEPLTDLADAFRALGQAALAVADRLTRLSL